MKMKLSHELSLFVDENHEFDRTWVADFNATVSEGMAERTGTPVGEPCAILIALDFPKGHNTTYGEIWEGIASIRFPMEWNMGEAKEWVEQFTYLRSDFPSSPPKQIWHKEK